MIEYRVLLARPPNKPLSDPRVRAGTLMVTLPYR
jgi:hypothetical protein